MDPKIERKLDPEFLDLLEEGQQQPPVAPRMTADALTAEGQTPGEQRVDLLVEFEGDFADLEALGFTEASVIGHPDEPSKIAAGSFPVARLAELAAIDHVKVVQASRQLEPRLNYSLKDAKIGTLHSAASPRKGKNVVIGVIDTGIEWRHGAFRKADGKTRILAIWDQELTQKAGEQGPPAHRGIGVEYSRAQIDQALPGNLKIRTEDERKNGSGHGSHVAGIAAGDGSPACCCFGGDTFIGMAPEADLIVVRSFGATTRLVQALDYIFTHPTVAGRPVVVNISLGGHVGAHDGTENDEKAIDRLVATPGRAVVVAAGNEGDEKIHIKASVPANGQLDVDFEIASGTTNACTLDLWYPNGTQLSLQVFSPKSSSAVIAHGANGNFIANPAERANKQVRVQVRGIANRAQNNDHNFRIEIPQSATKTQVTGDWKLRLRNAAAAAVTFHAWLSGDGATFDDATYDSTIGIPATARGALTVANYAGRASASDCCPSGDLAKSSSHGPVRANAAANPKPDLAAPGEAITSVAHDAGNLPGDCCSCCPDACCCLYTDKGGTSMAAPHVAGAVALMLEKRPNLTKAQILQHLAASALRPVAAPAAFDRNRWGAGKLNAQGAVNLVPPSAPAPAPVPSPDPASMASAAAEQEPALGLGALNARCTWLDVTRARLRGVPDGERVAALVSRHFSEVRRLINHQRRVATLWHRSDGPALLRRLMQGAVDEAAPAALIEPHHRQALQRFLELLDRFGSRRLRRTLADHRATFLRLLETPLAAQAIQHASTPGEEV